MKRRKKKMQVIDEVKKEWATGKWDTITIAVGKPGTSKMWAIPAVTQRFGNELENGKTRRELKKAIRKGWKPVGIIAMKGLEDPKPYFLPLPGSGFSVGADGFSFVRHRVDA
jgi:hypothetical protein